MSSEPERFGVSATHGELLEKGFTLVRESRWSFTYKKNNHSVFLSKLIHGDFEWSLLHELAPEDLDEEEGFEAALSIYGEHSNPMIPDAWSRFSTKVCGGSR